MSFYDIAPFQFVRKGEEEASYPSLFLRFLSELPSGCRVIDVGCGAGRDLVGIGSRGVAAIGADISMVSLQLAAATAPIVKADALRLPFGDGVADGVVLDGVAHHTGDAEKCVRESARVLR